MTEKKKGSRFALGLLLYALIFILLAAGLLLLLYRYMEAYELTRPARAVESFQETLESGPLPQAAAEALADLDPKLSTPEANRAWASALLREAAILRVSSQSSAERIVYGILARGEQVGSFAITATGPESFGMRSWELEEESYDFSAFMKRCQATIPEDYHFSVNGFILGPDYVIEEKIPYEALSDFYQRYPDLPTMLRYESGLYLEQAETEILDQTGRPVAEEEQNEYAYLDRCDPEIRELAEEFIPRFLDLYVKFSANLRGQYYDNFMKLRSLVLTDSQLHKRMRQAIGSFGFTTTEAVEIASIDVNGIIPLDQDHFLADFSYQTQITGLGAPVTITDHIHLVLYLYKDYLLAEALYNY